MKVLGQTMRLALMSLLLLVCGAVFAQTQVVFEAGVDKGSSNGSGSHHIDWTKKINATTKPPCNLTLITWRLCLFIVDMYPL